MSQHLPLVGFPATSYFSSLAFESSNKLMIDLVKTGVKNLVLADPLGPISINPFFNRRPIARSGRGLPGPSMGGSALALV